MTLHLLSSICHKKCEALEVQVEDDAMVYTSLSKMFLGSVFNTAHQEWLALAREWVGPWDSAVDFEVLFLFLNDFFLRFNRCGLELV